MNCLKRNDRLNNNGSTKIFDNFFSNERNNNENLVYYACDLVKASMKITHTGVLGFYIIASLTFNTYYIQVCRQRSSNFKHKLLISMATADMLQSGISYSMELMLINGIIPDKSGQLCHISQTLVLFFGFASISHFVSLSYERSRQVISKQRRFISDKKYFVSIWLYPVVWASLYIMKIPDKNTDSVQFMCRKPIIFPSWIYLLATVVFGYAVPLIYSEYLNFSATNEMTRVTQSLVGRMNGNTKVLYRKRRLQIARFKIMTGTMSFLFLLGWLPYTACALYSLSARKDIPFWANEISHWMAKCYVFFNPSVYMYWYGLKINAKRSKVSPLQEKVKEVLNN